MKRSVLFSSATLFLIIGITVFLITGSNQTQCDNYELSNFNFLQNGDLVLRRGRSVESMAVLALDKNSDYSHIGIVVVENGVPYIIHVVPDQPDIVRKELPDVFLSPANASRYKVLRSDFQAEKLNKVAEIAKDFFKRHLTFDNKYDLFTDSSLYCTELVLKAFKKGNIDFPEIVPQRIRLLIGTYFIIMPGSFLVNHHFTQLKAG